MKTFLTLAALIYWIASNGQDQNLTRVKYYSNGTIKSKISYNKAGLKNGESFYYSREGNLDSSAVYKNGMLHSVTKVYYFVNDIFCYTYSNNKLTNHRIVDSSGRVKYESPLSNYKTKKIGWRFTSGREYFDKELTDTIVVESDIPEINLNIYFPGAKVFQLGQRMWQIKSWIPQSGTDKGKMVVDIADNCVDDFRVKAKTRNLEHKVMLITLK